MPYKHDYLLLRYLLENGSDHKRDVMSCLVSSFHPSVSSFIHSFIEYEIHILVQELGSTSILRAATYSSN